MCLGKRLCDCCDWRIVTQVLFSKQMPKKMEMIISKKIGRTMEMKKRKEKEGNRKTDN